MRIIATVAAGKMYLVVEQMVLEKSEDITEMEQLLMQAVLGCLEPAQVVVDLSLLSFCRGIVLWNFLRIQKILRENNRSLIIFDPKHLLDLVLQTTRLDTLLKVTG